MPPYRPADTSSDTSSSEVIDQSPTEEDMVPDDKQVDTSFTGLAYRQPEWMDQRSTDAPEHLEVGDTVTFTKDLSDEEVQLFAQLTGDTNRLHLDEAFAAQTRFEGRIIHGSLLSGLISAALARLPGLPIYLSQDVEYRAPAHPEETLTAVCEVIEEMGEHTYRFRTRLSNEADELIIDGEALILVDDLPEGTEAA